MSLRLCGTPSSLPGRCVGCASSSTGLASFGARTYDAICKRIHHELRARFELKLAHDGGAMRINWANGDEQLLADLLIRVAEGQEMNDVALSLGERLPGPRAAGGDGLG